VTHIITSLCLRDSSCVEVCPVECIVPGKPVDRWPWYYIDPEVCIDCGACIPECPYEAIFEEEEVPAEEEDNLDTDEFDGEGDPLPEDEEELDEAISVIFDLIGESLASDSGHVDVIEILESDSGSSDHNQTQDTRKHHQVWETSEFSVVSIDEARATSVAQIEPAGQDKVFSA